MGTKRVHFRPSDREIPSGSNDAEYAPVIGTNFGVDRLLFDGTTAERADFKLVDLFDYPTNNAISFKIKWYGDSATSGAVVWRISIAALTSDDNVQTYSYATAETAGSGATASATTDGWVTTTLTIAASDASLDSAAQGYMLWIKLERVPTDGNDTMSGDAAFLGMSMEWSDV